jgi:hypothetical protein
MDKTEKVARRLHYIDYFYKQLEIPTEWEELTQGQRNSYLNYAMQIIKVVQET